MRVNNVYLTNVVVGQPETAQGAKKISSQDGKAGQTEEVSSHVPSSELVRLLSMLRQTPEVREDKIQQAQERLSAGFYLTPEAAGKTAEAIRQAAE